MNIKTNSLLALAAAIAADASIPATGAEAAVTEAGEPATLTEIIVTARKQSENMQNVPLSMQAVSSAELSRSGAVKLTDIADRVPGLVALSSTSGAPGSANLVLRGISVGNQSSRTTATTVDDVPVGASGANSLSTLTGLDLLPFDLTQVEVLEGPQGTLYGAASLGGLVRYVTRTPDTHSISSEVASGVETIAHAHEPGFSGHGSLNLPLVADHLAVSVSAGHVYRPGWVDNTLGQRGFDHGTQDTARLALYWEPAPDFSLKLAGIYNGSSFDGVDSPLYDLVNHRTLNGYYSNTQKFPFLNESRNYVFTAEATGNLGWANLTSVTGYSDLRNHFSADETDVVSLFVPFPGAYFTGLEQLRTKKVSQEVRLSASEQAISWTLGAFYTHESSLVSEDDAALNSAGNLIAPLSPFNVTSTPSTYRDGAAFASLSYDITPALQLSGGLTLHQQSSNGFQLELRRPGG